MAIDTYNNTVNRAAGAGGTQQAGRTSNSSLGKDEFLKILIMQLANQDPLEPMKDTEFVAQMAQFSSLEQMQQLNTSFESMKSYQMIGKTVVANAVVDGKTMEITGVVEGVTRIDGVDYLQIGEYLVLPSAVLGAYDANVYNNGALNGSSLVGKRVEATVPTEGGGTETISGIVEELIIRGQNLFAVIGGKEVPIGYITKIFADSSAAKPPEETPEPTPEPVE